MDLELARAIVSRDDLNSEGRIKASVTFDQK